jgi:hypothetical protein
MARTTQSKILAISSNPETIMLLLIVGELWDPEVSSTKWSIPPDGLVQTPRKRQRSHCFQCGGSGHFPVKCKAEQTVSGKPTTALVPNAKSKHAMLAPNGKQFCFGWAWNSSCTFGDTCSNFHGCSICGEPKRRIYFVNMVLSIHGVT